ncbi:peptidase S8/S53 domain-containing protein [Blastocladiella britannica]|nr:peptidase S8/S53 domain-containing protein [Blastocladiella britannica]
MHSVLILILLSLICAFAKCPNHTLGDTRILVTLQPGLSLDNAVQHLSAFVPPSGPAPIALAFGYDLTILALTVSMDHVPDAVKNVMCDSADAIQLARAEGSGTPNADPRAAWWQANFDAWARRVELDQVVHVNMPAEALVAPTATVQAVSSVPAAGPSTCIEDPPGNWGLARISAPNLPLPSAFKFPCPASAGPARVYILDTGIAVDNVDLQGRAELGPTFAPNTTDSSDGYGHGTFVAGLVGGLKYGVYKAAAMESVRVLGTSGKGDASAVMQGLHYVQQQAKQQSSQLTIANMSLGSLYVATVNDVVNAVSRDGVIVVAAAGNENMDACLSSPASAKQAIAVGATTIEDKLATFSNYGRCVTLLAPGKDITSAWIGSPNAIYTASGTSFSAPLVSGVLAQYAAVGLISPGDKVDQVKKVLLERAVRGKIDTSGKTLGSISRTPNILVQSVQSVQ